MHFNYFDLDGKLELLEQRARIMEQRNEIMQQLYKPKKDYIVNDLNYCNDTVCYESDNNKTITENINCEKKDLDFHSSIINEIDIFINNAK